MELPPSLQPFEALLPRAPGPQRVDALLDLSAQPHPRAEQVDLAEQARALASSLNDPARTARAELRLALLQEGPEALALVRAAAARFEQLGDVPQELACAAREAELLSDPLEQLVAVLRAAALAEETGQPAQEQALRTRAGLLLRGLHSPGRAHEAFTRALDLADRHDGRAQVAPALLALGELALEAGQPAAALEHLRAAGHLTHGEGSAEQARSLGGLGRAYAASGDPGRAARFLDAALTLTERLDRPDLHAALLDARAAVHDAQGDAPAAHALLRRSLPLTEDDWPDQHGETLLRLAAHAAAQGRAQEAREHLTWALRSGLDRQRPALVARAHLALADLAEAQRDPEETAAQLRAWADAAQRQQDAQARQDRLVEGALRDAQEALASRRARRDTQRLLEHAVQDATTRLAATQLLAERWRNSGMRDAESGAHSREFGLEILNLHYTRCARLKTPLSVAMVGVEVSAPPREGAADLFLNNVMSAVARVLEGQVRSMDTVARFDRFKFLVVFPDTPPQEARHPLDRLIEQIGAYDWGVAELRGAVTVAAGLVGRGFIQGPNLLVDAADAEQYRARRQGPNTLTVTL
ncbi:hypothetical protein [Deinococcus radiotolerans]|nr:hypothetical protein [Deinococcus radiotolerans]